MTFLLLVVSVGVSGALQPTAATASGSTSWRPGDGAAAGAAERPRECHLQGDAGGHAGAAAAKRLQRGGHHCCRLEYLTAAAGTAAGPAVVVSCRSNNGLYSAMPPGADLYYLFLSCCSCCQEQKTKQHLETKLDVLAQDVVDR